jgi:hypothetical protein
MGSVGLASHQDDGSKPCSAGQQYMQSRQHSPQAFYISIVASGFAFDGSEIVGQAEAYGRKSGAIRQAGDRPRQDQRFNGGDLGATRGMVTLGLLPRGAVLPTCQNALVVDILPIKQGGQMAAQVEHAGNWCYRSISRACR